LKREKEGMDLDPTRMADYEPWMVAKRAEGDVETVAELKAVMWPLLDAQDLQRVRALEDAIIPVVCEMEKNGAPIDVELLQRTDKESEEHYHRLIKEVSNEAGFNFDDTMRHGTSVRTLQDPASVQERQRTTSLERKPTFKDACLNASIIPSSRKHASPHSSIRCAARFTSRIQRTSTSNGILRVEYNQLRIEDETDSAARSAVASLRHTCSKCRITTITSPCSEISIFRGRCMSPARDCSSR
jgi:hypothetical protein